ncbi:uncharacterized protein LOC117333414 [Pecten maximus]|uniref:uncharacterized protein LOC117333414 n=1 Tax=Pecten maximus TaxID=6579 RepID=UPI001458D540|nr:uncharacterized protein LOC117333414 [Pecten maximus]
MPKSCCVSGCTANKKKNPNFKFFIIPSDKLRRSRWLSAINRAFLNADGTINNGKVWSPPSAHCYVCSAHFISGEKVNDPRHPDYVPSVFPHNENRVSDATSSKSTGKMDRYQRVMKRSANTSSATSHVRKRLKLNNLPIPESENNEEDGKITEPDHVVTEQDHIDEPTNKDDEEHVTFESSMCLEESVDFNVSEFETPMQRAMEPSEREMLYAEISNLRHERDQALDQVKSLEKLLSASSLSSESVAGNDDACKNMIGISWGAFLKIFLFLSTFMNATNNNLPLKEQLFLTLIKLRHNLSFDFLAHVKGIPKTTVLDYFWKWIDLMHAKLGFLVKWQDREIIFKTIPPVFKEKFPRLTSIIDCFEIFMEAPRNLLARAQCFSSYKRHTTVKVFISCSPLGSINFLSKAWGGRVSDVQIVRDSNFIDPKYHLPGDQILADRGFTLAEDFATKCSAELITPAFTKGKKQLPASEVETSRKISSVRIHIERVIGLMKNRFTILKGTMPVRCVQSLKDESLESAESSCDKLITVCAALTNLGQGIVYKG